MITDGSPTARPGELCTGRSPRARLRLRWGQPRGMELPTSPVTRQRLVATGCDDRELDRLVMSGRLAAPYRGVLLDAQRGLTLPTRALAALQSQSPAAVLGHETAAVILGLRWCPRE